MTAVVPAVDESMDRGDEVGDTSDGSPRGMAWRVMIEKKTSTRFSHDPEGPAEVMTADNVILAG